ncbi:MAG: sigma factor-like helix-turn-helix DNA-binding protein [Oscillospiraceae bacterium]|nr:sigma factor-like helix-turn-helix DNA-binding protein [Oscillospiraceae bacterium]
MTYTDKLREHIQHTFNAFCKTTLRYEAINACRDLQRKQKREVSLDYLHELHFEPGSTDEYFAMRDEPTAFAFRGETVLIENRQLVTALLKLSEQRREILFLRFFFGCRDKEIGRLYDCPRSTANYRKNAALRLLRKEMEVLRNGE